MLILPAISMLLLASCEKDDNGNGYSLTYEMGDAYFGTDSLLKYVTTDNGKTIFNSYMIKSTMPDTIRRCICGYYAEEEPQRVVSISQVYCVTPNKRAAGKYIYTDPFNFVSAWKSSKYVNFQLSIMTDDKANHAYGIIEDSITNNGLKTIAYITLAHRIPKEDVEAYSSDFYLSIPLKNYSDCDSMTVTLNTYNEGMKKVGFNLKN